MPPILGLLEPSDPKLQDQAIRLPRAETGLRAKVPHEAELPRRRRSSAQAGVEGVIGLHPMSHAVRRSKFELAMLIRVPLSLPEWTRSVTDADISVRPPCSDEIGALGY